jgi:hypothetical protein
MKKISYIIMLILIVTSCENFYEEDLSTLITAESGALTSEQGLFAALSGTYKPMAQVWSRGFGNASTAAILMGGDDLTTHKASNKADFREFDQYLVTNTNQRLPFVWNGAYKVIQGANNIIANYENAVGNQTTIKQIAGEAYFLRAYNYFWIVRLWGKAPLVLNTQNYSDELLKVTVSSEADIYAQIISDLEQSFTLMADKKPQPGRAGKGTAKAVLAQVYLQMTGWPLKDASKYALAASTAKDVIDNRVAYGFDLMPNYIDLWESPTLKASGNKEEVFAINFLGPGTGSSGNGWVGIAATPSDRGGWDDYFAEITFFNNFPAGTRKDVTFDIGFTNSNGVYVPWTNYQVKRPYYKKLQGSKLDWNNAISMPLIRLAEIYMIYAEAQRMATGNPSDPDALEAFNKIKRRGAGKPLNTPDVTVDATSLTQQQIIDEKGWEFAGEFSRWFDLVRLELVQSVVTSKDADELPNDAPITDKVYYLPLPFIETQGNPSLLGK